MEFIVQSCRTDSSILTKVGKPCGPPLAQCIVSCAAMKLKGHCLRRAHLLAIKVNNSGHHTTTKTTKNFDISNANTQ